MTYPSSCSSHKTFIYKYKIQRWACPRDAKRTRPWHNLELYIAVSSGELARSMAALAQQNNNVDEYFEAVKKGDLHEVKAFLRDGQVLPESTNKVCLRVSLYCKKLVLANM